MTRWMLDFARLGVFCALVLLAANTVFAGEDEAKEEKTYGLRITVEDGEVKVEQTGSEDMGELPEMLGDKIKQSIEKIGDASGKMRVEAKALMKDEDGNVTELPVEAIIEKLGSKLDLESLDLDALKDLGMDVNVWVEDDGKGQKHNVTIEKIIAGDDAHNLLKNLPVKTFVKALSGDVEEGEMDVDVNVWVAEDEQGKGKHQRKVIIKKMVDGEDGEEIPLAVFVKALGAGAEAVGDIDANVEVIVDGDEEGEGKRQRKVIIKKMKVGEDGNVELLEKIGGLKANIRAAQGQPLTWTAKGEGGKDENVFIVEGPWSPDMKRLPRATHRLGVAVEGTAGVIVGQVGDDTAADQAGLKAGDILLGVNGDTVSDVAALIRQVNEAGQSGSEMTLRVLRGDKVIQLTAEPRRVEDDEHGHDDDAHDHDGHDHDGDHDAHAGHDDDDDDHGEHADRLRELHERARAMAEEAQQQARRHVEGARRELQRQSRELQQRARELDRERRGEIDELRQEMKELRQMLREVAEEMKERD